MALNFNVAQATLQIMAFLPPYCLVKRPVYGVPPSVLVFKHTVA